MRPVSIIIVVLYVFIFALVGGTCIALALGYLRADQIAVLLAVVQEQQRLRVICFGIGVGSLAIGLLVAQWIAGRFQRERTIAFSNPAGPVTVSLPAIQEHLKRLAAELLEVKELKPELIASKRGLIVHVKATLWSDAHIPDATERLQEQVRRTLQQMLGIAEAITVRVHIGRIATRATLRQATAETGPVFHGEFPYGPEQGG
jgi:uncharacterized alkaline shock family protein YloU